MSSECSTQGQVLHCKRRKLDNSSAEGRSSTANSEQTLKNLKRTQGHQRGGEESGFG